MIHPFADSTRAALALGLSTLFQAAVLAVVVGIVDLAIRRRVGAGFRHALWCLVPAKLLLPPALELPTGLGYWIGRLSLEPIRIQTTIGAAGTIPSAGTANPSIGAGAVHSYGFGSVFDLPGLLLLLWIAGALALAVGIGLRHRRVVRLVRDSAEPDSRLREALADATREAGLDRAPALRISSANHSPAVCGFWRPVILLPRSLAETAPDSVLRGILLHELVHVRRRDLWLNALQAVVQAVWWWNPVAWFANARIRSLRELAVDEEVQRLHGVGDVTSYPAALVQVARHCSGRPMLALGFVGILESSRSLRQRVERLLSEPLPARTRLARRDWAVLVAAALLLLPMGFSRRMEVVAAPVQGASDRSAAPAAKADSAVPGTPPLLTRRYRLDPRVFQDSLDRELGPSTDPGSGTQLQARVREALRRHGIEFPAVAVAPSPAAGDGAGNRMAMFYNERSGFLFVRATQAELDSVDRAVALLNRVPHQVDLATKIVSVPNEVLARLSLGPTSTDDPAKPDAAPWVAVKSPAEARKLVTDLQGERGVDVLSAPRVTTLEGRSASIRIGPAEPPEAGITVELLPWLEEGLEKVHLTVSAQIGEQEVASGTQHVSKVVHTFSLPDRSTIILPFREPSPPSKPGHTRILVLTPTLIDPAGNPIHPESK